ncbi:hypothetical protein ACFW93_15705 [Streptomyces canus]
MAQVPTHVAWQRRVLFVLFSVSVTAAVLLALSAATLTLTG